jgi:DEAD/DEAH box helicase domain-containing protein
MTLQTLLAHWQTDPDTAPNFAAWRTTPARPAVRLPFPADLSPALVSVLHAQGIFDLYSHQLEAWTHTRAGENVVLATGTASGKTLAYNLPVLASLLEDDTSRALYIFPTKALAQDQLTTLTRLNVQTSQRANVAAAIYDGDTSQTKRKAIREKSRIILTNPDMLHTGILPHHTNWSEFFAHLKFVVIDETHTYRGVFGSHVANVIRRLKRVAAFYGAHPQFIFASATIGNPKELAERLVESPVHLIDDDGSARGPRHFIIYNPPVIDAALGLRKSAVLESVRLAQDLLKHDVQTVMFGRARRTVEMMLRYLQPPPAPSPIASDGRGLGGGAIRGYRSGYLPSQRREIEKGLRDGTIKTVVATNALELGIDIGGLGAAVLVGYPGVIASARQQAGRAGRGLDSAAAVLVASPNPLDQFLAHHPEYLFERSPEQALINPDHLLILLNHLRCALFELPFAKGEGFGGLDANMLDEFLQFLVTNHESHLSNEKYYWMADSYPAANISLRSASPVSVVLQAVIDDVPQTIGTVDGESAYWMAHPGAIYLHEAQSYFVEMLDLDQHIARLTPIESDYYTDPLKQTSVQVISTLAESPSPCGTSARQGRGDRGEGEFAATKAYGEIQVTTQVTGFRKRRWYSGENLGEEPLELPPTDLQTTGYWLSLSDDTVKALSKEGLWTNAPNDYGPEWPKIRERVRARDGYQCQVCGRLENGRDHDVHHKIPFRAFMHRSGLSPELASLNLDMLRAKANEMSNLVTLCKECHRKAEENVRMRSGLAGLAYALGNLAPLFLMCDPGDLGTHIEPAPSDSFPQPTVVLYDLVPAGIGFSQKLFEMHDELMQRALELVSACACEDGCPSCVGPGGENGFGGKQETLALLRLLCK